MLQNKKSTLFQRNYLLIYKMLYTWRQHHFLYSFYFNNKYKNKKSALRAKNKIHCLIYNLFSQHPILHGCIQRIKFSEDYLEFSARHIPTSHCTLSTNFRTLLTMCIFKFLTLNGTCITNICTQLTKLLRERAISRHKSD